MNAMDKDGSGEIDFDEFAEVMAEQFYKKPTRRELEAAFKYFDTGLSHLSLSLSFTHSQYFYFR